MKLTVTRYYLVLFLTTLFTVSCIVVYFYKQEDIVKKATGLLSPLKDKPKGTLLSIQVSNKSGCDTDGAFMSEAQVLALPQQEFSTLHKWSPVAETFRGPLLEDVLNQVCKGAQSLELMALNDYSIAVDFHRIKQYKPIIAHSINGIRLSIRDKGPLWIMLDHESYNIEKKNLEGLMIWQLSDIMILSANEEN